MSNSDIEQTGTVKGHLPNGATLSGRISNGLSLSGHISIGSVASDFIIKMTIASGDDGNYTLASCDTTVEQIDAAVAAEKRVVVIASDGSIAFELPMLQGAQGVMYAFGTFTNGQMMTSFVQKIDESTSEWQFLITQIQAESVDYSNTALPSVTDVRGALDELVPKSHTHSNKSILDKFSETDGKPTYDGKKISGASTAEEVEYTNAILPDASNVKSALDDTIDTQQTQSADLESLRAGVSALMNAYQTQGGDIASLKTQAHTHSNKAVLDKFAETDGKPTYNGEALGGGASDFIIKMTIEVNGNNYTVTSCDKTMEQIDAAVASGQNIKAIAFDKFIMPLIQIMENGASYTFGAFLGSFLMMADVSKNPESGADEWQFYSIPLAADIVEYSNDAMPRISTVGDALNELVPKSHTHSNKAVLDKFAETDGKPTYNGEALGGGASDFIIKMTIASGDDGNYTLASCDTTVEQIDAAVAAEKRVVVIASEDSVIFELPMFEGVKGSTYYFGAFLQGQMIVSFVQKVGENESKWLFGITQIQAGDVDYSNDAIPNIYTVEDALDKLVNKSHAHANKDTLDKLSVSNGKLQYNGSDVGLKGDTPVKGTDYWTAADKQEIVNDTLAALPTWTGGSY